MKKIPQEIKDKFNDIDKILEEKNKQKLELENEIKELRTSLKEIKDEYNLSYSDILKHIRNPEKYKNYTTEYYKKNKAEIRKKVNIKNNEDRKLLAEYKAILAVQNNKK